MDRRIRGGAGRAAHAGVRGRHRGDAPVVGARICEGLGCLGIDLKEEENAANAAVISSNASRVAVRVIHTDEEWMIANTVWRVLGLTVRKENSYLEMEPGQGGQRCAKPFGCRDKNEFSMIKI